MPHVMASAAIKMLSFLLFLSCFLGVVLSDCPSGWFNRSDYCYHFHDITSTTSGMSWNHSRLACQRYGADLLVIKDTAEQNFIASQMTPVQRRLHYWIGLTDEANEGTFVWIDGTSTAASGTFWRTEYGEPNNHGGNEDCTEMHNDGKWNDNRCDREFAFICKKHKDTPIPPAPTLPPRPSSTTNCKLTAFGTSYKGTLNTTISGYTCQRWDSQKPHEHEHIKPENHPSLVDNYCRNPDLEPNGPWCYTTNPGKRWEYCDVKFCESDPITCEAGWHGFRNTCYLFQKEGKSWSEAQTDCRNRGGDLVIVDSRSEHDFLTNAIKRDVTGYWIGLSDRYTEGTFFWVNGSQLNDSVAFWGTNEPSNAFGGEDCVEMWTWWNTGRWNDNRCSINRNFICEKVAGKSMCPEDWVTYNGMCYQINAHPEQKKTWLAANDACNSFEGAALVSISNAMLKQFIYRQFHSVFTRSGFYWLGLNDIKKEGQFEWTDNSKFVYANWGLNEQKKNSDDLDCVKGMISGYQGQWSLANCNSTSERNYYVCARKREYDRCHSPLGMEDFAIADEQITASSQKSQTTPPSSGRRNAVKAFGLDGVWCAATADKNQWFKVDLGEYYSVSFIGIQGHTSTNAFVKMFFLKYSPDGFRWSVYGYNPPKEAYKSLPGNSLNDKSLGATTELNPPIKARLIEIHPIDWSLAICMRVEFYGCPAVTESSKCGRGWLNNTALNSCYKIVSKSLPWSAARANCLLDNGDLLSIASYEENAFIQKILYPLRSKVYSYWIGFNSRDIKDVFQWTDGSPVITVKWYTGYPSTSSNTCVGIRTYDNSWHNTNCAATKPYVCKRKLKSPSTPNDKFTGNWISQTDHYWPLNDASNNMVAGSRIGTIFGTHTLADATINPAMKRQSLKFGDQSFHVVIRGFTQTCISNPSQCTNGVSFSMMLKLDPSMSNTNGKAYLLDILGPSQNDAAGMYAYVDNGRLGVFMRSVYHTWHSIVTPPLDSWFHFAFVWNAQTGLTLYLNGQNKVNDNAGTRTSSVTVDRVTDLYIGKASGLASQKTAKFQIMSLAIWERSLGKTQINDIYLAEIGRCSAGWLPFGQDCYQFNTNKTTFTSAKRDCERKGGKLATISTSIQQAFLGLRTGPLGTNQASYIGLNSRRRRRFFEWGDGSPVLFSHWALKRPSRSQMRAGGFWYSHRRYSWRRLDTVVMNNRDDGRWIDLSYYYSRAYICQRKRGILNSTQSTSETYSKTTSQYSTMNYGCPLGTKLQILTATFGKAPSCAYKNVLPAIQSRCARSKRFCSVYVTTSTFNNTCPGVRKELKTTYSCSADNSYGNLSGCDTYWSSYESSSYCYKLVQMKMNWANASSYCQRKGAQLVSIQSRTEELFLTSMLVDSFELGHFWTGLNDIKFRGNYEWSDVSRVVYTNWYNGEPDDASRRGSCVKATLNRGYRGFVSWTDDACDSLNSFVCKKLKASATTPAPVITTVSNSSCLPGWFRYKSNCYQFSTSNATWIYAKSVCNRQKSALVSIESIEENEAVFNFLVNASLDSAWIGLQDMGIFNGQTWDDGSPVKFVRWDAGQPNSNLGQQSCTIMSGNGFWRDNDCNVKRFYICKASIGKATVVPTTKALTVPVTPTSNLKYCLRGWVWSSVTRNCYYFSNRTYTTSWPNSRAFCQKMGGDLTSIESSAEQAYLEPFLLTFPRRWTWIGLSDRDDVAGWEWSDGKPVNYFNWLSGQPDNYHQMESCVHFKSNGQWSDINCGERMSFICKRPNNSVPVSSTVAPTAGPVRGYCEDGWIHYINKCYKIYDDDRLTWAAARNVCLAQTTDGRRGELVSIHSSYENAFLFSQMKGKVSKMYIGLSDIIKEGTFYWSDQTNLDYTNWYYRQPDNYWGREDCVEMWPFSVHKGKWNDVACSIEQGYICQKPASIVKTTTAPVENGCPNGYSMFAKNCYSFKKQMMTWDEAAAFCRKENTNSDLVSIHDTYEAAYVFSHMAEYTNRVWIGLHRPKNESAFRWSDNQPLSYTEWSSYPARRMLHLRSCVHSYYSQRSAGFWVDSNCTAKFPFICKITRAEKEVIPKHPGNCPKNWIKFDKYCYLISNNNYYGTKKWPEARQQCRDQGADLVSIHSIEEQNFLYEHGSKGRKNAWIGLNDRRIEKHMVWSDSTPLDFDNWAATEPNDNAGTENCIEMGYLTGKWNDNRCSSYNGYICKKELGCDDALGMENSNITDDQIKASSVYGNNFAQNARWNARTGWCSDVLDENQYFQVDFRENKRITRIGTQGFSRNYVLSFQLKYSDDGVTWRTYQVEGRDAILPANRASYTSEGCTLNPPVNARFLRIVPLTWKYRICMRLEFYGCGYVCYQPLGLEAGTIRNVEMKASSSALAHDAYDGRFRKPNGQGWCAQDQNADQWLQIHLSTSPMTVTRIATQGVKIGDKECTVKSYQLLYSDDGKKWMPYKTYKGEIRIFSGNAFAESAVFHSLSQPFSAQYVRFQPLSWNNKICMRVEVYGCPYECDKSLGIESGKIPDKAITASSSIEKHEASLGRLNKGSFNMGSWCAKENNQQQYLEIDLGAESRVTAIATQGFEGDISKYVTDYWIQFSMDGKFWSLYEVNSVIQELNGNNGGRSVNKIKLPSSIRARFIRVNPRHWKQGICMRVELFGCPLKPIVYPTDAPTPKKTFVNGKLKLTEEKFIEDYKNKSSKAYVTLSNNIETAIIQLYQDDFSYKEGFFGVQVTNLERGSVIASFMIIFKTSDANATWPLKKAVSSGKLGDFVVDKDSLELKKGEEGSTGKSTKIVKKEGLSDGGKAALIVIFVLMIVAIIIGGLVYYFRKRGVGQFKHQHFGDDDGVRFVSNEVYGSPGERIENLPTQN